VYGLVSYEKTPTVYTGARAARKRREKPQV
jgi:hypothetical protein